MVLGSADLKVKPFGLMGHQNVTVAWSNKDRTSLIKDPSNIAGLLLTARFPLLGDPGPILSEILATHPVPIPVPPKPLNKESETWAVVYSFEQFLWQPAGDPTRGVGMFFGAGVSDGKANPIKYSYSLGVVGKGVVPRRPRDHFGIGWARTEFSDNFVPYMRSTFGLGLNHEDAVELYYNASITQSTAAGALLDLGPRQWSARLNLAQRRRQSRHAARFPQTKVQFAASARGYDGAAPAATTDGTKVQLPPTRRRT